MSQTQNPAGQIDLLGRPYDQTPVFDLGEPGLTRQAAGFLARLIEARKEEISDRDLFGPAVRLLGRDAIAVMAGHSLPAPRDDGEPAIRMLRRLDLEEDSGEEILLQLWNCAKTHHRIRHRLCDAIAAVLGARAAGKPTNTEQRLSTLGDTLGLDPDERSILCVAYLRFTSLWDCSCFWSHRSGKSDRIRFLADCLGLSYAKTAALLAPDARLSSYKLLDEDFDLNSDLDKFISGLSDQPLESMFFAKVNEPALPWEMFGPGLAKHGEIIKGMIRSRPAGAPFNLLLYGEPGTGKTSFAHALAAELSLPLYQVNQSSNPGRRGGGDDYSAPARFAALKICDSCVSAGPAMTMVDEADDMLSSGLGIFALFFPVREPSGKGMLNSVLDQLKSPCVWIANSSARELDPSSRRRFDYSIRFDKLSARQREAVWRHAAKRHQVGEELLGGDRLRDLSRRYPVGPGGINLAVRSLARLAPGRPDSEPSLHAVLEQHCQLLGLPVRRQSSLAARDYSLEGLNLKTSTPLEEIVAAARNFLDSLDRRENDCPDAPRLNLLLSGPPGSGKTEFVKHLGERLDTEVLTRVGSDLLSMWVGGTEHNIANAFRQAESQRVILFLDEADGLLRSRGMAQRSWEVTQANELLHQMENFNGVLVCATNFIRNLDPASIRRFTFKVQFDYLDNGGKELFYRRMLSGLAGGEPKAGHLRRLSSIPRLCPGDFRTARQSLYYLAPGALSHDRILEALEHESGSKLKDTDGGSIGFKPGR